MDPDVSLATLKLKERIVGYLHKQYRKVGINDAISWRAIWIECGATEEEFRKALSVAAKTELIFAGPDHVRLRSHIRSKNNVVPTNIESSSTADSEQPYGRVVTLIRLFLQYGKKQPVST